MQYRAFSAYMDKWEREVNMKVMRAAKHYSRAFEETKTYSRAFPAFLDVWEREVNMKVMRAAKHYSRAF